MIDIMTLHVFLLFTESILQFFKMDKYICPFLKIPFDFYLFFPLFLRFFNYGNKNKHDINILIVLT